VTSHVGTPRIVTSAEIDQRLEATYKRVGLRAGLLEGTGREADGPSPWGDPVPWGN